MKGYNENHTVASTSKSQKENVQNGCDMNNEWKCGIYHKIEHYALRCSDWE